MLGDISQTVIPCLLYIIYLYFICLHTYLLLFGSYLILSSCQQTLSLSHYYWNPPALLAYCYLLSLLRLLLSFRDYISSCLQVALTEAVRCRSLRRQPGHIGVGAGVRWFSESGSIDPGLLACTQVWMQPYYVLLTAFPILGVLPIHKLVLR